jgi:hypothetical protein
MKSRNDSTYFNSLYEHIHCTFYSGLRVDVKLEKAMLGKWTKQGRVKEIHLTVGDIHEKITRLNMRIIESFTISKSVWHRLLQSV